METAYLERDVDAALSLVIRFERAARPGAGNVRGKNARFYAMRIERDPQLTLDGTGPGFVLHIIRGAIGGKKATTRRETFRTLARAIERWGHFCAERRAHGYHEATQHA